PADVSVFRCPSDGQFRFPYLSQAGARTYNMPWSPGPDTIFFSNRELTPFMTPPTRGQTLNRGIGQLFTGLDVDPPMWIKKTMVKPTAKVLLLVERSYAHTVQWVGGDGQPWGYDVKRPGQQLFFNDPSYGNPMLHGTR